MYISMHVAYKQSIHHSLHAVSLSAALSHLHFSPALKFAPLCNFHWLFENWGFMQNACSEKARKKTLNWHSENAAALTRKDKNYTKIFRFFWLANLEYTIFFFWLVTYQTTYAGWYSLTSNMWRTTDVRTKTFSIRKQSVCRNVSAQTNWVRCRRSPNVENPWHAPQAEQK